MADKLTLCRWCWHGIEPATRVPTRWTHRSLAWLGDRCPNGSHYAEPFQDDNDRSVTSDR